MVRERSRVQSSLAAPSFPKENQHLAKISSDAFIPDDTEQIQNTQQKLGKIWVGCSPFEPPPDHPKEYAATAATGRGAHLEAPFEGPKKDYAEGVPGAIGITEALSLNYLIQLFDEMGSYTISGREAARRGSLGLVEGHFEQVAIIGREIRQIISSLKSGVPL